MADEVRLASRLEIRQTPGVRKPMIATPTRRLHRQIPQVPREGQKAFHLRPRSPLVPEGDRLIEPPRSSLWTWVAIVALIHCGLLAGLFLVGNEKTQAAPLQFISLLPAGDLVQGSPGASQARKRQAALPAEANPAASPPAAPALAPIEETEKPPRRAPERVVEQEVASDAVLPPRVRLSPPKPPQAKIKVSLAEVTRPLPKGAPSAEAPSPAKVSHPAKHTSHSAAVTESKNSGRSPEQVASELGEKLAAEGVAAAEKVGPSGAPDGQANSFAAFYASVRDQVMNNWEHPEVADSRASPPIVRIHIDSQNHVPPEQVSLVQSSGNAAYDESALAAARRLGYLQEPLPDGCSPDITIKFTLTP